jgi:hypothetical protein
MVFKLEPTPYDRQVQSCIMDKQFELALSIAVSGRSFGVEQAGARGLAVSKRSLQVGWL